MENQCLLVVENSGKNIALVSTQQLFQPVRKDIQIVTILWSDRASGNEDKTCRV